MSRSSELAAQARALLAERLSAASLAHCERVGTTARELAVRFGVDADEAMLAGLLHDVARDESDESLLALTDEMGVPATAFEHEHPYLLHARVGAALVRKGIPGVGEAVLSAIEVHTVGALPMSDLDKVVFLADMLEPARVYEGVDELRSAARTETLAESFRLGYAHSVRHVQTKGRPLHPISAAVGAWLERETGKALFDPAEVRS